MPEGIPPLDHTQAPVGPSAPPAIFNFQQGLQPAQVGGGAIGPDVWTHVEVALGSAGQIFVADFGAPVSRLLILLPNTTSVFAKFGQSPGNTVTTAMAAWGDFYVGPITWPPNAAPYLSLPIPPNRFISWAPLATANNTIQVIGLGGVYDRP